MNTQPIEPRPPRKNAKRRARKKVRGLTLIEILVVVTILGIIAGIIGVNVIGALDDAKVKTTQIQMKSIGDALEMYKIKYNRYPTTAEGLGALEKPPSGGKPLMDSIPKDGWQNDFIYVCPGQKNPAKFDISSKGADSVGGNEDDIHN